MTTLYLSFKKSCKILQRVPIYSFSGSSNMNILYNQCTVLNLENENCYNAINYTTYIIEFYQFFFCCPFSISRVCSGSHITFTNFFSLMSSIFKIQQSFFVFHNLSAFKEYQTIILLLFLKLDLFDILSYLGWGHAFSAVISQELCCVLLNISYKGDHDLCLTSWDVNCDHMIKVMSFSFFTIKLPSLPL